ncbi:MAG: hypothetical protein HY906_09890 [Deltaproteobacteria bacterium]|nr:hypothetical protein [Deltaproteobacteria bacterium]
MMGLVVRRWLLWSLALSGSLCSSSGPGDGGAGVDGGDASTTSGCLGPWRREAANVPGEWLQTIWGASPDDVWAVGDAMSVGDAILHRDGATWSNMGFEHSSWAAVWGLGPDAVWVAATGDAWAVGAHGLVFHYEP